MWRFIVVTFGFLGLVFYELSGGGAYAPRPGSLQAGAQLDDVRPRARPAPGNPLQMANAGSESATVVATLSAVADSEALRRPVTALSDFRDLPEAGDGITLALAPSSSFGLPIVRAAPANDLALLGRPAGAAAQERFDHADLPEDLRAAVERASLANLPSQRAQPFAEPDTVAIAPDGFAPAQDIRRVAGSRVNLRDGPGTSFGRVAQLSRGTEVAVIGVSGSGWLHLRVLDTGRVGWMSERLVTASTN